MAETTTTTTTNTSKLEIKDNYDLFRIFATFTQKIFRIPYQAERYPEQNPLKVN